MKKNTSLHFLCLISEYGIKKPEPEFEKTCTLVGSPKNDYITRLDELCTVLEPIIHDFKNQYKNKLFV